MEHMPLRLALVTPLVALLAAACVGATQTGRVWTDPSFETNSLRKLMVIGVGTTPTIRRSFEDRFVAALQAQGIVAEPSYRMVGDERLDSARTSAEMHRTGCDGVLVTRIVDQQTVTTYYPPTPSYAGLSYVWGPPVYRRGWYGYSGWYGYYGSGYSYATSPGYTVAHQVVNLETALYRVADGQLVWSALSQEWRGQTDIPGSEIEPLVRQLVGALLDSRVVSSRRE